MEFKGTKGKWHIYHNSQGYNSFSINSKYKVVPIEEMKANALLISKAPEMLDMLKWFVYNFEGVFHENTETNNKVEEAKQLIKEATEI